MSLEYIRETYRVPAYVDVRVRYTGGKEERTGVIVGARNAQLKVRMDGAKRADHYHPTWKMEYLP